jgi:hypothetical protein
MISDVLADLKGDSLLTTYINGRVYRGMLPPNPTYPLILFEANKEIQNTLSGESTLQKIVFEFEIHGRSYVETKNILGALTGALNTGTTYRHTMIAVDDGRYNDETEQYQLTAQASIWG